MSYKLKKKHIYFLSVLDSILIFFWLAFLNLKGQKTGVEFFATEQLFYEL